ncbi:MAG: YihY/virulence factor BrkB family protein [Gammaproteobacteria bacterium]|nr:YihY/virulence factor BrkB family protein [Gammaproteobacteria bacterium]
MHFYWFYVTLCCCAYCHVRLRDGLIGAFIATLLFSFAKKGFALCILYFPTYNLLYGAFAAMPVFLLWIYLSWMVILLGAEISHALGLHYQYSIDDKLDCFTQAYRYVGYLWQAQQRGGNLSIDNLLRSDQYSYPLEPKVMMRHLKRLNFLEQNKAGNYFLTKNLAEFTFAELYHLLPWRLPEAEQRVARPDQWQQTLYAKLNDMQPRLLDHWQIPLANLYQH